MIKSLEKKQISPYLSETGRRVALAVFGVFPGLVFIFFYAVLCLNFDRSASALGLLFNITSFFFLVLISAFNFTGKLRSRPWILGFSYTALAGATGFYITSVGLAVSEHVWRESTRYFAVGAFLILFIDAFISSIHFAVSKYSPEKSWLERFAEHPVLAVMKIVSSVFVYMVYAWLWFFFK